MMWAIQVPAAITHGIPLDDCSGRAKVFPVANGTMIICQLLISPVSVIV